MSPDPGVAVFRVPTTNCLTAGNNCVVGAVQTSPGLQQRLNGSPGGILTSASGAETHRSPGGAALEQLERQFEAEAWYSQAFQSRLLHSVTGSPLIFVPLFESV
jgi:hypothetical protein